MTYHCGIGAGMAALGIRPRDPYVVCDAPGCAARCEGLTRDGMPRAWIRSGKAPPGWRKVERAETVPLHYCPKHKGAA